jgi:hypothetical protein
MYRYYSTCFTLFDLKIWFVSICVYIFNYLFIYFFFVASSNRNVDNSDIDENLIFNNSNFRYYSYDDLYTLLKNRGPLNPHSIKSRRYLLEILKVRYKTEPWEPQYTKLVEQIILKFL